MTLKAWCSDQLAHQDRVVVGDLTADNKLGSSKEASRQGVGLACTPTWLSMAQKHTIWT